MHISEDFNWVSLLLALLFYRKSSKSVKILSIYLVFLPFIVLAINLVGSHYYNNMYLKHILSHFEIVIFSYFYYQLFDKKFFKQLVVWLMTGYIIFALFDTILYEDFSKYPSNIGFVYGIMIILYSLFFFYQVYEKGEILYIEKYAFFWINSAFLIYYSGTLFLGLFSNYLMYRLPMKNIIYLDSIFSVMSMVFNVLVWIGLWLDARRSKTPNSTNSSDLKWN